MHREVTRLDGRIVTSPARQAAVKLVLGAVTLAVGAGLILVRHVTLRDTTAAREWVETPCVVEQAEFIQGDEGERTLSLRYRYRYGGEVFYSDRLDLLPGSMGDDVSWERQLLAKHPAGSEATCYVDPRDPSNAVLDREHGASAAGNLLLLAFPFLFIGVAFCFAVGTKFLAPWLEGPKTQHPSTESGSAVPAAPRKIGVVRAFAYLFSVSREVELAWAFFVGFAFVFRIFDGPSALADLWPSKTATLPATITQVTADDQFVLHEQQFEYTFRFEALGSSRTGASVAEGGLYKVGDQARVVFDPARPDAAHLASARRYAVPVGVMVIPGLVLVLLAVGIVGSYLFNFRSLWLLRGGQIATARRNDDARPQAANAPLRNPAAWSRHEFDVDGQVVRVDLRSHVPRTAETVSVLYDPRRPQRNMAIGDRQKSILFGASNLYAHELVVGIVVPGVALGAVAWLWGYA